MDLDVFPEDDQVVIVTPAINPVPVAEDEKDSMSDSDYEEAPPPKRARLDDGEHTKVRLTRADALKPTTPYLRLKEAIGLHQREFRRTEQIQLIANVDQLANSYDPRTGRWVGSVGATDEDVRQFLRPHQESLVLAIEPFFREEEAMRQWRGRIKAVKLPIDMIRLYQDILDAGIKILPVFELKGDQITMERAEDAYMSNEDAEKLAEERLERAYEELMRVRTYCEPNTVDLSRAGTGNDSFSF